MEPVAFAKEDNHFILFACICIIGESVQCIFLVEAKWFKSGQLPRAEGYLKNNGIISCEVKVVMVHIVSLLGEGITNRSVELLNGIAAIISSTAAILRLWDELETEKAIFAMSTPPNIAQKMNLHLGHSNLIQLDISKPMSTMPLTPPCLQDDIRFQHEQKLEVFRNLLSRVGEESLNMIDAIQRLGIDYHFEEQIDLIISSHANALSPQQNDDLHEVSLRFRLLRQHGHFVPEDMFNNFKEREGKYFKQILNSEEVKGLMSVYEASQLSMEGEDALDEAGKLSGHLLNRSLSYLGPHEARLNFFLPNSQAGMNNRWLNMLQEVAKTDFNLVQSLHHKEIVQISKWWKELGLTRELKFARDEPVKWYVWSMACLTDPNLSEERIQLTKPISFIYLIDDIFDVYGTLDELTLFTEAVNRWEIGAIEHLPDYMKICFEALYNITNEISCEWGSLCNAFLVEAKWFKSGHLPKAEDYLKNGIVSSGVNVVMVHIFFLLGQGITKQSVELVNETPAIVSSTAAILRLWDDFGSAEDENQSGHDGSYVRCYLQEHPVNMISKEWKSLNKELVSPNYPFPATFTNASLNLARMVPLMYNYDDNQHLPSLEVFMKSMLYETESVY
ncbi:unnamed protein product [Malus baccata var. baccata]